MIQHVRSLILATLAICSVTGGSHGQNPGDVLSYQKISNVHANGPPLSPGDQFGRACAVLGDVDGDGIDDLAVGVLGDDDGSQDGDANYGAIWILFMRADETVRESQKISNTRGNFVGNLSQGDEFGRVLGDIGDFDGDGVPDVAVGSCFDDDGASDAGALYLLFLNSDGTVKDFQKISAEQGGFTADLDSDDQFGRAVAALGDLDGDGVGDLAVGSVRDDDGGTNKGALFILFLNADGTVKAHQKISDTQGGLSNSLSSRGEFAFDFANLGDLDGDGIVELAVAAPDQKTDGNQVGAVFILFLNSDGTVKSDIRITEGYGGFTGDLDFNDEFGACCDIVGDLDDDGYVDLAVGAGKDDDGPQSATNRGAVWILFLNGDGTVKAHQKISLLAGNFSTTLFNGTRFGTSLAWAKDRNGDGADDLFVGARFDNEGGQATGSMFLLHLNNGDFELATAEFSADPRQGPQPHRVAFTDLSSGDVSSWSWDFGDGESSTEREPVHDYGAVGAYTVTQTVTGVGGVDSRVKPGLITVTAPLAPVAALGADATTGVLPFDVSFSDLSTGVISSWSWDFGDGASSSEIDPDHRYMAAGVYSVELTVTGPGGSDSVLVPGLVTVTSPDPPVAAFDGGPVSGDAPLSVSFQDLSTGGVTAWSWSFGDGQASSSSSPTHVYASPGTFTVSLAVVGPAGADSMTRVGFVTAESPAAPTANFVADVVAGFAPLAVNFGDLSTGQVSSWSWTFGDGGTSSESSPAYVYSTAGVYTVSLSVKGLGGSDTTTAPELVQVDELPVTLLADRSFEYQIAGAGPQPPWIVFSGAAHVVNPDGAAGDNAMPVEGEQWLEISAVGTVDAAPPATPGGATAPATGGAGVTQDFLYPEGQSVIEFVAAFILEGDPGLALFNDWMSIDVTDGTTTQNLFYRDSFSELARVSEKYGLAMTTAERVRADLGELFPDATHYTPFTLLIQVGNGGDSLASSRGYVDDFQFFEPVESVVRYGCGLNPSGSLSITSGRPSIGTSMMFGVDNPFGTQGENSTSVVILTFDPDPGYPCGTPLAGFGMSAAGAYGELLVSLVEPNPIVVLVGEPWSTPGNPAEIPLNLPNNPMLVGQDVYAQGYLLDPAETYGIRIALTDALKLTIGQ